MNCPKIIPFWPTQGRNDGRSYQLHGGGKTFIVNFQYSDFVCFWSVSRETVK